MKILVAGDFCSRYRTRDVIDGGTYDKALEAVVPFTAQSDYSILNLECPILKGAPSPIEKQGPNLHGSVKMAEAIKYMGFDCVTLANNHFYDQGETGVNDTLQVLNEYKIDFVGGGRNLEDASAIRYKEFNDGVLAIINCCEHEFSIATDNTGGSNPLNPIKQYYDIQEAKKRANYVLVIVHGGHENYQLPSPRMVETYRFFIDVGADAVINHHQHCYSGYELYQDKLIFYGLGNFFFDQDNPDEDTPWNYGYCIQLTFSEKEVTSQIYPYEQCKKEPKIDFLDGEAFDDKFKEMNSIISNPERLALATREYYKKSMCSVEYFLNPYQSRLVRGLLKAGIIPSLLKKKWLLKLQNYICCEAHRDKLDFYLKNKKN